MGAGPLVSVIIPTWNRRDLVQQAVASVVAQTYSNWELIVVDDGSTDGTVGALRQLHDPRVRVIAAERAGSAAVSRNRGIDAASGEWIAFLDSDDLWVPDKLELQLAALGRSGAGWCYGNHALMDAQGGDIPMRSGNFRPLSGRIAEALLQDRTGACVDCLLVRRDIVDTVGTFDSNPLILPDLDFTLRVAAVAEAVAVPQVLARVREHPARETRGASFPHEQAAQVYRNLIARNPGRTLESLGRKRLAAHLGEAAVERIDAGHLRVGLGLLGRSLLLGDEIGHWLRTAARGALRLIGR